MNYKEKAKIVLSQEIRQVIKESINYGISIGKIINDKYISTEEIDERIEKFYKNLIKDE